MRHLRRLRLRLRYRLSAAVLTLIAGLAAWLPARRACAIDPSEILRRD